jgi:hypothetical protein
MGDPNQAGPPIRCGRRSGFDYCAKCCDELDPANGGARQPPERLKERNRHGGQRR